MEGEIKSTQYELSFFVAPWWAKTDSHLSGTLLGTSCHDNCAACAYKNKSLTVHRHFDIHGAIFFPLH